MFKKDTKGVEFIEMAEDEKTKNHPGGLGDKADEADPKMFAMGETNCPVYLLKKLIYVLNPSEEALFQRPKRKFCLNDEIWFDRAPLDVNSFRKHDERNMFCCKIKPNIYKSLYQSDVCDIA